MQGSGVAACVPAEVLLLLHSVSRQQLSSALWQALPRTLTTEHIMKLCSRLMVAAQLAPLLQALHHCFSQLFCSAYHDAVPPSNGIDVSPARQLQQPHRTLPPE
jgi:hypothetical protein